MSGVDGDSNDSLSEGSIAMLVADINSGAAGSNGGGGDSDASGSDDDACYGSGGEGRENDGTGGSGGGGDNGRAQRSWLRERATLKEQLAAAMQRRGYSFETIHRAYQRVEEERKSSL